MLPELSEISRKRRILGISQVQLAKLAGVSQSLVAKVENGSVVPSYSNAKAIFDVLTSHEEKEGLTAGSVMISKVLAVKESDRLSKVLRLFKEEGISQVPVFDGQRVVGSISEQTIVDLVSKGRDVRSSKVFVEEVMDDSFSVVDQDTPLSIVSSLLKYNSAVLVSKKGKVNGIITKADLIRTVQR